MILLSIFLGCSHYKHFKLHWADKEPLLSTTVNLLVAKSKELAPSFSRDNCSVINGHYFDYNGFQIEWKSIRDQIFSFNNSNDNVKLQVQHLFFSHICSFLWYLHHYQALSWILHVGFSCQNRTVCIPWGDVSLQEKEQKKSLVNSPWKEKCRSKWFEIS